jgi:hypothetical protein
MFKTSLKFTSPNDFSPSKSLIVRSLDQHSSVSCSFVFTLIIAVIILFLVFVGFVIRFIIAKRRRSFSLSASDFLPTQVIGYETAQFQQNSDDKMSLNETNIFSSNKL